MKQWLEPQAVDVPPELAAQVGGHPLVAETLIRRGISDPQTARAFLDPAYYQPASPYDLPDMARAVERVARALQAGERIGVWGDFDVDGQTATTLLVSALRGLGAQVTHYIPNRQREGHGVHLPSLAQLLDEGVTLVLTCDTGIDAHSAVQFARTRGVDLVITDHHQLPPALPDAYAVVNPQRLPEAHPLRTLPGVGVAYKLVEALYARAGRAAESEALLDLVALGIVADVALQTGDTRYLLQRGLDALRRTARLGLRVLMETAELDAERVSEEHIGFTIGPRLNALGRLDDANVIVELLTTDDRERARLLAAQLEGLNTQRRLMTDQVYQGALAQIANDTALLDDAALVLGNPHWPSGVVGIAATRLVERFNRPVILLVTPEGEAARGSARSVEGLDITAAIAAHADLLLGYGGHTMAAGLSLDPARIAEFRRALSRTVRRMLGAAQTTPTLRIDGYVALAELSLALVEQIERLAPFGAGNPPLTLASRGLTVQSSRVVGRGQEHLLLALRDEAGTTQRAIWWNGAGEALPEGRFDLAYVARASDYRGQREVQIEWLDARPLGDVDLLRAYDALTVEVLDYRQERNPLARLKHLQAHHADLLIWAEAGETAKVGGTTRENLRQAAALAIWTMPPGAEELAAALRTVAPQKVFLFATHPGSGTPERFVKRLGGLLHYALNARQGEARLVALAGAMGHREITVRKGIEWLVARGAIAIAHDEAGLLRITKGHAPNGTNPQLIDAELQRLLDETTAYRRYFKLADARALLS